MNSHLMKTHLNISFPIKMSMHIYIYIYPISNISNKYHVSIERNDSIMWEYMGYNFTI